MQTIDTLIHARWIIPVEPDNTVLENHCLAIHQGRILALLPSAEATQQYQATDTQHLDDHALIPGLINAHTHAAMSLFRGLADDLPLMEWLNEHIWPAEGQWVCPDFVSDGTELAIAEMLRGGTTCFNDMYFFPDQTARVAAEIGMRATVGLIVIDFPSAWATDADDYITKGLALHDEYRHHPLIKTALAPHAPYTVSDEPLQRIVTLAEELDTPIHMHIHETEDEVSQSVDQNHCRPLARLEGLGLFSPRLLAVHMTQLNDNEIKQMAEQGCHVIHSPESNLKLASGFCPVHKLMEAGINVALGTDGAASNNDLDMFGEMRTAALLAKAVSKNTRALPAHDALKMATLNGARALGIDDDTGSLCVGKSADVVAIDLSDLETQPVYHPISQLVYATGRDKVTNVWIAGRQLLKNRELTTINVERLLQKTQAWQQKISLRDSNP